MLTNSCNLLYYIGHVLHSNIHTEISLPYMSLSGVLCSCRLLIRDETYELSELVANNAKDSSCPTVIRHYTKVSSSVNFLQIVYKLYTTPYVNLSFSEKRNNQVLL